MVENYTNVIPHNINMILHHIIYVLIMSDKRDILKNKTFKDTWKEDTKYRKKLIVEYHLF